MAKVSVEVETGSVIVVLGAVLAGIVNVLVTGEVVKMVVTPLEITVITEEVSVLPHAVKVKITTSKMPNTSNVFLIIDGSLRSLALILNIYQFIPKMIHYPL